VAGCEEGGGNQVRGIAVTAAPYSIPSLE